MTSDAAILEAIQASATRSDETGHNQLILHDVSLECKKGEVLAVIGPSGGGKSTLLRLFNRLLEASSGRILFNGKNICGFSPPWLRRRIALVPQKPFLYQGTVKDNLVLPARIHREPVPDFGLPRYRELIELCRIEQSWLNKEGHRVSLGQQQRICLARALVGPTQALLLDEPTSSLDRPTAEALAGTFRDLAKEKGLALILVTHDLHIAQCCADRLAVLINGRIVESGPTAELMANSDSPFVKNFQGRSSDLNQ